MYMYVIISNNIYLTLVQSGKGYLEIYHGEFCPVINYHTPNPDYPTLEPDTALVLNPDDGKLRVVTY